MPDLPAAVLFACNFNVIRSPMASALMRHFLGHRVFAQSAGVRAGTPDPFAIAVMDEIGIDLGRHVPIGMDELYDTSFDLIVSLSPQAHHRAMEMTRTMAIKTEYWPTHDPTLVTGSREQKLDAYRGVRDDLMERIKTRFMVQSYPNP